MTVKPDNWDRDEDEALEAVREELDALRKRHEGDPPVDLLRAAHSDALPDDLQEEMGAHLRESRWSRALVEGLADMDAELSGPDQDRLLRRIHNEATSSSDRRQARMAWLALPAFAAIVLIVAGSAAWNLWHSRARIADPAPPAVAKAPTQTAPVFVLPLEKADVRLTPAALTWRVEGANTFVEDVKPALDAYRAGDYARADAAFNPLVSKYPQSVEVLFYQGVSRLLQNDAAGAGALLARAERLAEGPFVDDVGWYRAVADERTGDIAAAREQLQRLCRGIGPRSRAACDGLARLQDRQAPR